jgi:hypothetical protein
MTTPLCESSVATLTLGIRDRDMKSAAIVIRNKHQQFEGLRISLGLLLNGATVEMFVLHDEIAVMDEAYRDNMEFIDEMDGLRFSNNSANVEKFGFRHVTLTEIAARLVHADVIIPL